MRIMCIAGFVALITLLGFTIHSSAGEITDAGESPSNEKPSTQPAASPGQGVSPLNRPRGRKASEVLSHADRLTFVISARAPDDQPVIRVTSVNLAVPITLWGPAGIWPDGTRSTVVGPLERVEGEAVVDVLDRHGFFERAKRFHSLMTTIGDAPPPTGSSPILSNPDSQPPEGSHISVEVTVNDGKWYLYHIEYLKWDLDTLELVGVLQSALKPSTARLASPFFDQLEARIGDEKKTGIE